LCTQALLSWTTHPAMSLQFPPLLEATGGRPQSSRLAEFGGRGMSFNVCRGTLGSLAMFFAIRNASSRNSGPNRPPSWPLSGV
jgi:hypothetical protein